MKPKDTALIPSMDEIINGAGERTPSSALGRTKRADKPLPEKFLLHLDIELAELIRRALAETPPKYFGRTQHDLVEALVRKVLKEHLRQCEAGVPGGFLNSN